jgi:2-polyprenyl-6-methoxyphenol hydroxylase-like FAD-dependent oxidoreductase
LSHRCDEGLLHRTVLVEDESLLAAEVGEDRDGEYVDRPLFVLPAPTTWEPSSSIALLGDAAHQMPPAGVGVNLAMLDASELALAIAHADTVPGAIRAYEATMIPRSHEYQLALDGKADFLLRDDSRPESIGEGVDDAHVQNG